MDDRTREGGGVGRGSARDVQKAFDRETTCSRIFRIRPKKCDCILAVTLLAPVAETAAIV